MAKKKSENKDIKKKRDEIFFVEDEKDNLIIENSNSFYSKIKPVLYRKAIPKNDEFYKIIYENIDNIIIDDRALELDKSVSMEFANLDTKDKSNEEFLVDIKKSFAKEQLVLVLGAGVSTEFGLPNWNSLLQKLLINSFENDPKQSTVLSKIFNLLFSPNPIIAGRYLEEHFSKKSKNSFVAEVRKALYENIDYDTKSPLIDEIVNFCAAPGKSPNLDSIITYNYDNILEYKLNKLDLNIPYKAIYGSNIRPDGISLPIYHVHGFLPQKGRLDDSHKITLSDSIYHEQYNDIYNWTNIVQINKFRDNSCLFIGISLTDPNIRRLLDVAKSQKGESNICHYMFRRRYRIDEIVKNLKKLLEQNSNILTEKSSVSLKLEETAKALINVIEKFEINDGLSFGVNTIWVDSYDEIPNFMSKIRMG